MDGQTKRWVVSAPEQGPTGTTKPTLTRGEEEMNHLDSCHMPGTCDPSHVS